MWDMDWQSEIKESYKTEVEAEDTSTGAEEEVPKADSKVPVSIVIVAAVLAVAVVLFFCKK